MAAGYLATLGGEAFRVISAGTQPAESINPVVIEAMQEDGIDLRAHSPTPLRTERVQEADVVITMGCGDACPVLPGKHYEDWSVQDPAGQELEVVRRIRDDIKGRVQALIAQLTPAEE